MDRFEATSTMPAVAEADSLYAAAHKNVARNHEPDGLGPRSAASDQAIRSLEARTSTDRRGRFSVAAAKRILTEGAAETCPSRKESNPLSLDLDSYILSHTVCRFWTLSGDVTEKRDVRAARI
ncbi:MULTISPECIES: hypothetical protein [Bradyrhizobium]|jgi:hypothetical protein|uniref:hypothetical protein n=1 Tax=Bradyrhizobium TaxID=374 RepID=UPI0009A64A39|nr:MULTISPECIES: hypothetical protein [Bradyrhizobium]